VAIGDAAGARRSPAAAVADLPIDDAQPARSAKPSRRATWHVGDFDFGRLIITPLAETGPLALILT
jgi:hypothetical protein